MSWPTPYRNQRPIAGALITSTKVIHGTPIISSAPFMVRKRAGTGTTAPAASDAIVQRAAAW